MQLASRYPIGGPQADSSGRVLGTGIAYVLLAVAAGRVGPTRASATAFLIPGVALILGVMVRGERVAMLSVIGGAVRVAGAWLMRRAQIQPARGHRL